MFSHTEVVFESKMVREMLHFTMEMAVGGCEGRRCETAGAAMVAYGRLCSASAPLRNGIAGDQTHCNGGFQGATSCR